jgi:hypothetical protein
MVQKQLDPHAFYSSIQDIFAAFGSPYGTGGVGLEKKPPLN